MSVEPTALEPPQDWFGSRYAIERPLRQGAMGRVYLARQIDIGRRVVVKALPPEFSQDEKLSERFKLEMKVMSLLEHPNTVRLYDFGTTTTGEFFIVMEYVDGHDVQAEVVDNGPMHPARVIRLGLQVARALHAAHSEGVIHRDLKPENIMIRELYGEKDVVTVLDFGIAKFDGKKEKGAEPEGGGRKARLTTQGMVVGTPQYVSPEQAAAEPLDQRSDIYALGCVLYFAAVGEPPFADENIMKVLWAHIHTPPEPPARVANVPPQLSDVIMRCLEKQPDDRYQTAAEVAQALIAVDITARLPRKQAASPAPAGPAAARTEPSLPLAALGPAAGQQELSNLQKDLRPDARVASYSVGVDAAAGENSPVRPQDVGPSARPAPMQRPQFQRQASSRGGGGLLWLVLLVVAGGGAAAWFLMSGKGGGEDRGGGPTVDETVPAAVRPHVERCLAGNSAACLDAARMHRLGEHGVPVDDAAAKKYYSLAIKDFEQKCKKGTAYFCYALGNSYSEDRAVPLDLTKASAYYARACDLGYEDACALK